MNLSEKKCVPCEGGVEKLSAEGIKQLLENIPNWQIAEGMKLVREYKFKNFKQALNFVNKVGDIAEAEGHHPDIELGWGFARIYLYTHAIGGLHENDFILAAKVDALG